MEVAKTVFAWLGFAWSLVTFAVLSGFLYSWLEERWERKRKIEDAVAELRDELADW